jgi:hypothetical protein
MTVRPEGTASLLVNEASRLAKRTVPHVPTRPYVLPTPIRFAYPFTAEPDARWSL